MRNQLFAACVWVLTACGAFLFTSGALDYWESRSAQDEIASRWANAPENPLDAAPDEKVPEQLATPHARSTETLGAVAKLSIPRLNTALYVVEGTSDRDLKRGPGHLEGTVLPGEDGNCVIAGHRDTHFRVLQKIRDGDEIVLERDGRVYRYRVDGMKIVTPDNTASLQPVDKAVLNLVTCYPFRYLGAAPKRFVVHADLEGSTLAASR